MNEVWFLYDHFVKKTMY